jgi:hypothetical protein
LNAHGNPRRSELHEPDSGLSQIIHLNTHLRQAHFGAVIQNFHQLKTGQLHEDPQLAQLSVETLAQSILSAKRRGAFKEGMYSFGGHSVIFPRTTEGESVFRLRILLTLPTEWANVMPQVKAALSDGMEQQIITVAAQRPQF